MAINLDKLVIDINDKNNIELSEFSILDDYIKLHIEEYLIDSNINLPKVGSTIYWLDYSNNTVECIYNGFYYNDSFDYLKNRKSRNKSLNIDKVLDNFTFFSSLIYLNISKKIENTIQPIYVSLTDYLNSNVYSTTIDGLKILRMKRDTVDVFDMNMIWKCDCCGSNVDPKNKLNHTIEYQKKKIVWDSETKGYVKKLNRVIKNLTLCSDECIKDIEKLITLI